MRRNLHPYNVLNIKVFQRSGVRVLSFVILDNYLLYNSIQQEPVLNSVATSLV